MTSPHQQYPASNLNPQLLLWILALLWIGLCLLYAALFPHALKDPLYLLFPAVGLILLALAAYQSLATKNDGRSILDFPFPPACGHPLAGMIHLPQPFLFKDPIHLRLVCIQTISTYSSPVIIWLAQCTLDRIPPESPVSLIPIYFTLPADARPSDGHGINAKIRWTLEVTAKTTRGTCNATFRFPMRPPPETTPDAADPSPQEIRAIAAAVAALQSDPHRHHAIDRHIRFSPLPEGGCRVALLPRRNMQAGLIALLLGLAFSSAGIGIIFFVPVKPQDAHPVLVLAILFTICGFAVLALALHFLFVKTTITARPGLITTEWTAGITLKRRVIQGADIVDIKKADWGQVQNTPVYLIRAARRYKKPQKICGMIYDSRDADWLITEFKNILRTPP